VSSCISQLQVTVELENVQKYDGDLLVGADGIWSKVLLNSLGFQAFF